MKFKIDRASVHSDKLPHKYAQLFLEDTSRYHDNIYTIDINTLEELLQLVDEVNEIIIWPKQDDFYKITIYDYYIE